MVVDLVVGVVGCRGPCPRLYYLIPGGRPLHRGAYEGPVQMGRGPGKICSRGLSRGLPKMCNGARGPPPGGAPGPRQPTGDPLLGRAPLNTL